jgi:hypothetical protein
MNRGAASAKVTLFGIVARDAPVAVVFRRGPTRHVRLIRWDLRTDALTLGQWLVGTVDAGPSGLSADGELLVYCARKGRQAFTAVSRPPYFTALAFWEKTSFETGGGFFDGDRRLVLGARIANPREAQNIPEDVEITDVWEYFWRGRQFTGWSDVVPRSPEANHGFRSETQGVYEKSRPSGSAVLLTRVPVRGRTYRYRLEGVPAIDLTSADWADWAPDGSLLVGAAGRLLRYRANRAGSLDPESVLVADLRGQVFERIAPPEAALRWP